MSEKETSKAPSFEAFQVKDGKSGESYFTRVGAAFAHKDGQGHTVALDAIPVDGRIVLRSPKERLESAKEAQAKDARSEERER